MNRNNRKSGFTIVELLVVLAILFIVLSMVAGAVGGVVGTSDGKRVGLLTKFSYKGVFIKSYEGELNMGGVRNRTDGEGRSSMVANVWEFSCSNPTVAKQLDDLLGKEVVIKYHQSFAGFSRHTSYDVVSVEEVKR
jgi:hypothetical protein